METRSHPHRLAAAVAVAQSANRSFGFESGEGANWNMKCTRCHERESTGYLINLCDECFDQWEAEVNAGKVDIGPVDASMKYQSAGGLVPDSVEAVRIRGEGESAKVEFVNRKAI